MGSMITIHTICSFCKLFFDKLTTILDAKVMFYTVHINIRNFKSMIKKNLIFSLHIIFPTSTHNAITSAIASLSFKIHMEQCINFYTINKGTNVTLSLSLSTRQWIGIGSGGKAPYILKLKPKQRCVVNFVVQISSESVKRTLIPTI
jgi:hypothetical protein